MRYNALAGALALAALCGTAGAADDARLPLRIGPHAFQVELASTPQQRQRGLMGRAHVAADGGMLFVFEHPGRYCFWMRDTLLPLSIAFIADDGSIVNIADMEPRSEKSHCSAKPVRYALEVRQGEFQRRGITPHMRVDGLPH